jgi:hypothetical protein
MASTQRPTRRRSAKQAFEDEEMAEYGTSKKSRADTEKPMAGAEKPKRKTRKIG